MTHLPAELTQRLLAFRVERDWEQFHNARSLATALSVEASELLEHFIWAKDAEVAGRRGRAEDGRQRAQVPGREVAWAIGEVHTPVTTTEPDGSCLHDACVECEIGST